MRRSALAVSRIVLAVGWYGNVPCLHMSCFSSPLRIHQVATKFVDTYARRGVVSAARRTLRPLQHRTVYCADRSKSMPPRKKMSKREARPAPASENQRLVGGWRDRLKMAMDKRNVSQRRLSQDSGLGPTTVRHLILQANTVSLDTCARLADGLGISVTWLMTGQHGVSDSTGNGDPKVVRALPIWTSMDVERAEPAGGEFVAVRSADYPADVRALRVPDQGLIPEGANLPPPPETILASGDIVLFTRTL